MNELVDRLRSRLGADAVLVDGMDDYAHDATFVEQAPVAVVRPRTVDEVSYVLIECGSAAVPVVARGAGSGLAGGAVALNGGLVLSLERMRHLSVSPEDATVTAEAGVITAEIHEAVARHGLMYPPDPASFQMSTIGGNVACNSGGMSCVKYGVTADYVLGMTVVLADGRVLRLGGRTRKRSSGYRLMSLFIGSEGTLGIMTEVTLKLIPRPRHRRTAMIGYTSLAAAAAAVSRLLGAGHLPAAIELIDRNAMEIVAEHLPRGFHPDLDAVLIVEQDGNDPDRVIADLLEFAALLGGADNRVAQTEAEREGLWKARRQFGHKLLEHRGNYFAEDVSVPISQIPEMVRRIRDTATRFDMTIATVGHAGDGNLHPCIIFRDEQRGAVGSAAAAIFRDAVELGGSISAEHGLGAIKRDHAMLEHGPDAIDLMHGLKRLLDPGGILNPHKVLPEGDPAGDFLERLPGWGVKLASGRDRSELGA